MEALLKKGLAELRLDEGATPSLLRFGELLLEKNKVMNLTAITEPADVAALHFLDSAALLTLTDFKGKSVVDVGTGAGFPGMPLKILEPTIRMTLLDSLGKRITFLQEVCDNLGLTDVQCVHARAEEFAAEHRQSFDSAVSRAVAILSVLCELCLPLVKAGGYFLSMKSVESDEELESLTGTTDIEKALPKLFTGHVQLVVYTCGSAGAYAYTRAAHAFAPCQKVRAVDTTGAGDGFIGSFLWQLSRDGVTVDKLENLSCKKLEEYLDFSNRFCGLSVQKHGAIDSYPTLPEMGL